MKRNKGKGRPGNSKEAPQSEGLAPHALSPKEVLERLHGAENGLSAEEEQKRREKYGPNTLPRKKAPGVVKVFFQQFLSPFIYILLIAAVIATVLQHWQDAGFIALVLLINAVVGTIQEYSAERSAEALQQTVKTHTRVLRNGEEKKIDAVNLVPGDIVLLESGSKVPADIRLLSTHNLSVDESLLTGESEPVLKNAEEKAEEDAQLGDRKNMVFAATLVTRGRGRGVVAATGLGTQIGHLSETLQKEQQESKAPLVIRMETFTNRVALAVLAAVAVVFGVELSRGTPPAEVFLLSVALAVSAIPAGLPVALTVALATGMNRMAKRNVIIRKLFAVEALGSCTFIAADKTGTLTVNELTVRKVALPGKEAWEVGGEGVDPEGHIKKDSGEDTAPDHSLVQRVGRTAVLCNEGRIRKEDGRWIPEGDTVDTALLVLGAKAGLGKEDLEKDHPRQAEIPFESQRKYAASLNEVDGKRCVSVKGAAERLLEMCRRQVTAKGETEPIQKEEIERQAGELAAKGFRVLALADGEKKSSDSRTLEEEDLKDLTFLALVGMIDPLRPEARQAVAHCQESGIEVSMVTGDHPKTALAIAGELNFADNMEQVITGKQLKEAVNEGDEAADELVRRARVFARVEPEQKVHIVASLKRQGHFIAVTGDGANDAPALSSAHVGVAMGKRGTDVARESSALLLTDDNFASIVNGIEEGRIAYSNVRKVIFLLISTGVAEVVLFGLSLIFNMPLPLLATQLLWLNVITNGIQDVALALEPAEGNELKRPPRDPREKIFNPLMLERLMISGIFMGVTAFVVFHHFYRLGWDLASARNSTLLLMVLFENVHVFNSRSEYLSVFRHNPLQNPVLLFGTVAAQLIHIGSMYTPWLKDVIAVHPVSPAHWLQLLGLAMMLLLIMEAEKFVRMKVMKKGARGGDPSFSSPSANSRNNPASA